MKRYFIAILIICLVFPVHAISSYKASYDLYAKTDLGNINLGTAEYELIVSNNTYFFTSNAKTNKIWSALYDYSIDEISIKNDFHLGIDVYNRLLDDGVCPEQARMVLPQSTMTEWYWSGSLDAFADMCRLRITPDTQYESKRVALGVDKEMLKLFPISWKALEE